MHVTAMPPRAGLYRGEPVEGDDLPFDQLRLLITAEPVQEVPRVEADGHELGREPVARGLKIIGVDRERVLCEKVAETELALNHAEASLLNLFAWRQRAAHGEQTGF